MKIPLYFVDQSGEPIVEINITGSLPDRRRYPVTYAGVASGKLPSVEYLRQYYDGFLCYLELYEFKCGEPLKIRFRVTDHLLFFFFIYEGEITFKDSDGALIDAIGQGNCTAIFYRTGIYEARLSSGNSVLLYNAIQLPWLENLAVTLPAIRHYLNNFLSGTLQYIILPRFSANAPLRRQLKRLIQINKKAALSTLLQLMVTRVIAEYHELLTKDKGRENASAYRALDFIGKNYREPNLSNTIIANALYTTKDTLCKHFFDEFNMTPHVYIVHLRMQLAHDLLAGRKADLKDVYILTGYRDPHTFRVQFKRYFGYPPGSMFKD